MAKLQTAWGIDIGNNSLKALRLRASQDGAAVVPEAIHCHEYPRPLDHPDAHMPTLIEEAVDQFITNRNIAVGEPIAVNVSGRCSMARFMRPPPVMEDKLPDIVKYEARQMIPFDLEDVYWDWVRTWGFSEQGMAIDGEFMLQAVKRPIVDELVQPFKDRKVRVRIMQSDPIALMNALYFDRLQDDLANYDPDDDVEDEPYYAVLSIGGASTELLLTNGFKIWHRNIPLGGSHFTRQIGQELKLTFAKAEYLKINARTASDPMPIFKAVKSVFEDLAVETKRSLSYFASIEKKAQIKMVLLTGGGTLLPGLSNFLQTQLTDVESVEPWASYSKMQDTNKIMTEEHGWSGPLFRVAYGLGLQALGISRFKTNMVGKKASAVFSFSSLFSSLKRWIPRVRIDWER